MLTRLRRRRAAKRLECKVSEEWCGLFIGRRQCRTHNVVWDDGGACPRQSREPGEPFSMGHWHEFEGRY